MEAITLKPRAVEVLRRIAHQPRTLHGLTHAENGAADVQCAPHVIRAYVDDLVLHELVSQPPKQHGYYSATDAGREYLANLPQVACSTLICNASMPPGSYKPAAWFVRSGGNDHQRYGSLRAGGQG